MLTDAVIVAARRTPIGTAGGALAAVEVADLAAPVLGAVAGSVPLPVGEVVLGNCMGPGGDVARVAALAAGLPHHVPALTVDRQCASGLSAIALGAALVRPGQVVLAGGLESASTAPWRFWPPVDGADPVRFERAPFAPAFVGDPEMGLAADLLAHRYDVARDAQDAYAVRSHARAHATREAGGFDAEVVPVGDVVRDQRPRAGLTVERLSRFPTAFREGGTVTAGNSCGVNDGAAAVALVDARTQAELGIPGLRVVASATVGVDPTLPGLSLAPAARRVLSDARLSLDEVDVIEFNEAFAGQILACCLDLDLDPERVCPQGGALGLGHPWGASGAVLAVRLFHQLQQPGQRGLAAIAAGGGQGVALLVERVAA